MMGNLTYRRGLGHRKICCSTEWKKPQLLAENETKILKPQTEIMKKQTLVMISLAALLASATQASQEQLAQSIRDARMETFRTSEQLKATLFALNTLTAQKKGAGRNTRRDILSVVRGHPGESGIVYCSTRRGVEHLTDWFVSQRVHALPYHAGLDDRTRARNQEVAKK